MFSFIDFIIFHLQLLKYLNDLVNFLHGGLPLSDVLCLISAGVLCLELGGSTVSLPKVLELVVDVSPLRELLSDGGHQITAF